MSKPTDKNRETDAKKLLESLGYNIEHESYYTCSCCGKSKALKQNHYYQTNNPMYDGCKVSYESIDKDKNDVRLNYSVLPICKTCIENMYNDFMIDSMKDDKLSMFKLTQELRIPWIESHWETSKESKSNSWKIYIGKLNSLPQYSSLTIRDSETYIGNTEFSIEDESKLMNDVKMKKTDKKEALIRWGIKWNEFELARLEEFYHSMKSMNKVVTPQDEDYLRKLARLSVKIDSAIESDMSSQAKQLGDLYSKYMSDSKFRAMDMTDADKQGGLRTFSQIFEEVERPDFIPPWIKYKKFLNIGQDMVDKTIMHIENFTLRFGGSSIMTSPPNDTPKFEGDDNGDME